MIGKIMTVSGTEVASWEKAFVNVGEDLITEAIAVYWKLQVRV
ncbi:hypothetical protein AB1282_06410 [Gottfriedia sp. S16(2024)]